MAIFHYVTLDAKGSEQRGEIEAVDRREAADRLRAQGVYVVEINLGGSRTALSSAIGIKNLLRLGLSPTQFLPLQNQDRMLLLHQMALMLRSGYTVVQALEVSVQLAEKRLLKLAIERMADRIRKGATLSTAMRQEKSLFPGMEASLVASGERSGDLSPILERLSFNIERRMEVRQKLISAMIYPVILLLVGGVILHYLITVVIPRFATFLAGRGSTLPPLTQFLLDLSDWFAEYGPTLMSIIGITLLAIGVFYTTSNGKQLLDRLLLALPLIGKTIIAAAMAQSSWTFGMLLRSGVPMLDSLRVTANTIDNRALAIVYERAADRILTGQSLTTALANTHLPKLVQHMAAVGERSGELVRVMEESGEFYRKELAARITTLEGWMVPLVILLVAVPIGVVYYAFLSTLLALSAGR